MLWCPGDVMLLREKVDEERERERKNIYKKEGSG